MLYSVVAVDSVEERRKHPWPCVPPGPELRAACARPAPPGRGRCGVSERQPMDVRKHEIKQKTRDHARDGSAEYKWLAPHTPAPRSARLVACVEPIGVLRPTCGSRPCRISAARRSTPRALRLSRVAARSRRAHEAKRRSRVHATEAAHMHTHTRIYTSHTCDVTVVTVTHTQLAHSTPSLWTFTRTAPLAAASLTA